MGRVWSAAIAAALACACGGRSGNGGSDAGKAGAAGATGGAGASSATGGQSGGWSGASGGSAGQVGGNSGSGGDAGSGANAGDACSGERPPSYAFEITTDPVETTICPSNPNDGFSPVNACGCDDLVCAPDEMCILVIHPSPSSLGGPPRPYNGCFDLCESNDDCPAPEVCIKNLYGLQVCALPECLTDGDCTAEPCGQCIPGFLNAHVNTAFSDPTSSFCVYEGSCDSAACSSCLQVEDWYRCQ